MLPINNMNVLVFEEEERLRLLRNFNVNRRLLRDESDPFNQLPDIQFKGLYRLTKDIARFIINGIMQNMMLQNNPVAVPVALKFFGTLQFLATGSYQKTIGQNFQVAVSQQQMSKAIFEVIQAIIQTYANKIKFPSSNEIKNTLKMRFMEATHFPGVIGAVDGTHVAIIKPNEEEHNYFNRKGYHSKNVQIICDYDLTILGINARFGGAAHDSFIWAQSTVRTELERCFIAGDQNTWLLGDSGYPLQPWLLTPILNAAPQTPEFLYTQRHMSARNCVERCIGVLKGRFRCLLVERKLRYTPFKVAQIINTCAILHNICTAAGLDIDFDIPREENGAQINYIRREEDFHQEGLINQRNIINNYFR